MLNDYLKLLRKYTGKTQIDAAIEAGIDLSKYKAFEHGKKVPDEAECLLLSKMLCFDEDVLSPDAENSITQLTGLFENQGIDYEYENCTDDSVYIRDGLSSEEIFILSVYRKATAEHKEKIMKLAKDIQSDTD